MIDRPGGSLNRWAEDNGFTTTRPDWRAMDEAWTALVKDRHDNGTLSDGGQR